MFAVTTAISVTVSLGLTETRVGYRERAPSTLAEGAGEDDTVGFQVAEQKCLCSPKLFF